MLANGVLKCDMARDCAVAVSMLDNKGFAYCAAHGLQRRYHGTPCRKLQAWEVRRMERGEALRRY